MTYLFHEYEKKRLNWEDYAHKWAKCFLIAQEMHKKEIIDAVGTDYYEKTFG